MNFRAIALATVATAALTVPASAATFDYLYGFTFSGDRVYADRAEAETVLPLGIESSGGGEGVVEGILGFDEIDTTGSSYKAPGLVEVTSSDIGGVGEYTPTADPGQGFKFNGDGDIVDADYRVEGPDGSLDFSLEFFGPTGARQASRYVFSCEDFVTADTTQLQLSDCVESPFDNSIETEVNVVYTRLDIPEVPLPAGLPLMLAGIAGFAGLRARRKKA